MILCGIDESRVACEALRTARHLAEALNHGLVAAHVVAPAPVLAGPDNRQAASASPDDLAAGEALLERACVETESADVDRRVVVGRPAERLAELADDEDAELIVVGSRGHQLLRAAFVGGVSSELLGLAPCPVLVVPALALSWEWEER
jgi:nucleotide-binding universal stress UspA family protein